MNRTAIPRKLRFEVFKRDRFTCQYCGSKAPEVVLEIDHITPVADGGSNDLLNLITSCKPCNLGKGDRRLADTTVVQKQHTQLAELEERREQLEMLLEWQRSLADLDKQILEELAAFWSHVVSGYQLNDNGRSSLRRLLGRFNAAEITEAMRIAAKQYLELDGEGLPSAESVEHAWSKVGGICNTRRREAEKPYLRDLYYVRGIIRKRFSYYRDDVLVPLLEEAFSLGASAAGLQQVAKRARSWSAWQDDMEALIDEISGGPSG